MSVRVHDLNTGKNSYFSSGREAARSLGVSKTSVNDRLRVNDRTPLFNRYVFYKFK